mmetsp:Transcript_58424/g.156188  ORF Transcript_58424/g.156188 Transcript_58424/m.156188 type:complete len:214 (-) Transcript_58424:1174-1815(-)
MGSAPLLGGCHMHRHLQRLGHVPPEILALVGDQRGDLAALVRFAGAIGILGKRAASGPNPFLVVRHHPHRSVSQRPAMGGNKIVLLLPHDQGQGAPGLLADVPEVAGQVHGVGFGVRLGLDKLPSPPVQRWDTHSLQVPLGQRLQEREAAVRGDTVLIEAPHIEHDSILALPGTQVGWCFIGFHEDAPRDVLPFQLGLRAPQDGQRLRGRPDV